jgi:outer membrane protein with beta-barrel domain
MRTRLVRRLLAMGFLMLAGAAEAQTSGQTTASRLVIDVGIGVDPSINGNVNSGAIGTLQGLATAILPQSYGDVYGTGIGLHFGGGYLLNDQSEVRAMFTWQSADADLVRLGDIGPSNLYAQYDDYKSFGLDVGYRRYFMTAGRAVKPYGEALIGIAWVDGIDAQFAAPQANVVIPSSDFYHSTAAFTWNLNVGVLMPVSSSVDVTAQVGLRHVGGLSQVDQFAGTGLEDINNDTGRLTFPIGIGVRFHFR